MVKNKKAWLIRLLALMLVLIMALALVGGCEPTVEGGEETDDIETNQTVEEGDGEGEEGTTVSGKEGTQGAKKDDPNDERGTSIPKVVVSVPKFEQDAKKLVIASSSPSGPVKGAKDFAMKSKRKSEIENKYSITMEFVNTAGAWETYYNFYVAKVQAKEAMGDICEIGTENTYPGYVMKKYVQTLDPNAWKLNDSKLWNVAKNNELKYKGNYYMAAPISYPDINNILNTPVLFFNKFLLKEAGYNENQLYTWQASKEWTWARFTEVVKKINGLTVSGRKDIKGMGSDGGVGGQLYSGFLTAANTGGGYLIPAEQKAIYTLDTSEARMALNYVHDLLFKDKVGKTDQALGDWTTHTNKFQNGTLGFYGNELQHGGRLKDQKKQTLPIGDLFGIVLYPIPKDRGVNVDDYQVHIRKHGVIAVPPSVKTDDAAFINKINAATEWYAPDYSAPTIDEGSYDEIMCDTQSRETFKLINQKGRNVYSTDVFNGLFPSDLRTGPPGYMSIDQFLESIRVEANNRVKDAYKEQ